MKCPACGFPVDLDNESQPVCPACGADPFDPEISDEPSSDEFTSKEPTRKDLRVAGLLASFLGVTPDFSQTPSFHREQSISELRTRFQRKPSGIRNEIRLHKVCLRCGNEGAQNRLGKHWCPTPKCGEKWYASHCWNCENGQVDSRDPEIVRCSTCKMHICILCSACSKACSRVLNPMHRSGI